MYNNKTCLKISKKIMSVILKNEFIILITRYYFNFFIILLLIFLHIFKANNIAMQYFYFI